MPKTLFQNIFFTLMMSFLMVYVMVCYNIALNMGGMSNEIFLMAFGEMKIMWPVAFLLEFFVVDKMAHALAFRIVTPKDRQIVIVLATWFETTFFNFPVALFWQIFYCGPCIRFIFGKLFLEKENASDAVGAES